MKKDLIYEGKAKKIWSTANKDRYISEFKDDLTAFNGEKKSSEVGKGMLNNKISTILFKYLEKKGIKTHFIEKLNDDHMLHQRVDIINIEVIVRNIATGSLTRNLGIKDGTKLPFTLIEFDYKNDELGDPKLNDQHCVLLGLVDSEEQLHYLRYIARRINTILSEYFLEKKLVLVDFKLEFGIDSNGNIILADELSPDNFRLWDLTTGNKLDKDLFREGGSVTVAYTEVLERLLGDK